MTMFPRVAMTAVSAYTPSLILDNEALIKRCNLSVDPDWIFSRTGIRSRHWMQPGETTSDMALSAAQQILSLHNTQPKDIDIIILATITGDYPSPSTATIVARKLGVRCMAFDISAACAGFLYALNLGISSICMGSKKVLVIAADARSRFIDPNNRRSAVLFADAAAGALLEPTTYGGFLAVHCGADGGAGMGAYVPAGGAACPASHETIDSGLHFVQLEGRREIFELFVRFTREACDAVLAKAGLKIDDIDLFITHQGNALMVSQVAEALGVRPERTINSITNHGNVVSATVPLALAEAMQAGRLSSGDRVLLTAVGAGYTFGAAIYQVP